MKERPILFSGPMVQAILEGRKTQTRRVDKRHPLIDCGMSDNYIKDPDNYVADDCPYGKAGDLLWVRETWAIAPIAIHYRADNNFKSFSDEPRLLEYESTKGWRPSIFMPRWASHITLEITDVRVQRVQEIGIVDARAEGIILELPGITHIARDGVLHQQEKRLFQELWDSLNAKRGYPWKSNPWVWALTFQRI